MNFVQRVSLAVALFLLGVVVGWMIWGRSVSILSPFVSKNSDSDKSLERFRFDYLRRQVFEPSNIILERVLGEVDSFTSHLFTFNWEGKKISGLANIPKKEGKLPVVIMIRGYVDKDKYQTGVGTSRAGEIFAKNGFITLAPDFLGFGESDPESENGLEDRFGRPSQIFVLITSLKNIPQADTDKVFMWAHSNGGQVALSVLEISQKKIPTTLWAPVSKAFPYSVLYYSDEMPDKGKYLRRLIAEFEQNYNPDNFSIDVYFSDIQAPLLIHQGTADDAVPIEWSNALVKRLEGLEKDVTYYTYPGADHNMVGSWDVVVVRDLAFFQKYL